MDERSRPNAGRRRAGGECVRCTRKATSPEPDAWAHANTGGSGASIVDLETRAELELRHAGARSTERTWFIAHSPALATREYRMPRRWHDWDMRPAFPGACCGKTSLPAPLEMSRPHAGRWLAF